MAEGDKGGASATDLGAPAGGGWRPVLELVVAGALAIGGVAYLLLEKDLKPESWIGFGLIGLAVFILLMRGQAIRTVKIGRDGIQFDVGEVLAKVRKAEQVADSARQIALQQITPGGGKSAAAGAELLVEGADGREALRAIDRQSDGWDHPRLTPGDAPANDPQKNQWGGEDTRNGRRLTATVRDSGGDLYEVQLVVEAVGSAAPVTADTRFHLHDTFPRQVRTVRPKDGRARLSLIAWGAFTVGAEVEGEPDTFLELDLADPRYGFPERFRAR
jgi:hypothetical protein